MMLVQQCCKFHTRFTATDGKAHNTISTSPRGAMMMLAFGLGTLPNLLLAGLVLARLNEFVRRPVVRTISGLLVLGFGLYGFFGLARLSGWL